MHSTFQAAVRLKIEINYNDLLTNNPIGTSSTIVIYVCDLNLVYVYENLSGESCCFHLYPFFIEKNKLIDRALFLIHTLYFKLLILSFFFTITARRFVCQSFGVFSGSQIGM